MDPKAVQSLERGFWYRLGGGVLAGSGLTVAFLGGLLGLWVDYGDSARRTETG